MGTRMTMQELLNDYNVEIPIIQRDYVQGRQNVSAKAIREKLLSDMKEAVKRNKPLDLNFVYGKKDGEKFIPIDGQQRLTTLFLLYLYAFRNDDTKTEILKKFTYKTRETSCNFLEKLVEKRGEIFETNEDFPKPSDKITDSSDFVSSYNYDPTVQSVLVMLDEIAENFHDVDKLSEALQQKENPPLSFNFLDIEELGSEDSLYIKLNARGKPLTDFENLKAKLQESLRTLPGSALTFNAGEFEFKFDRDWTDLFWKRKNTDYEKEYQTFFKILLFNYKLIGEKDENWVQTLNYENIPADVFISAYNLLSYLCSNPTAEASSIVFKALDDPTASNRVSFHFVSVFLLKHNNFANSLKMNDWIRVFKNLVNNTLIDKYETALAAVNSINEFAEDLQNLTNILDNIDKIHGGFNVDQLTEEKIKAKIIRDERRKNCTAGGDFETAINNAEKLPFFGGQIRAGLYLAGDKNAQFGYDLQKFRSYWDVLEKLFGDFNDESSLKYGILLRCALLSIGDYTLSVSNYKTLCIDHSDASGRTGLKRLFSDREEITTTLLGQLVGKTDIAAELNSIITTNLPNIPQKDWRYCLIMYPNLFNCMSPTYYRMRVCFDKILLVSNASSRGTNYEIFTSALKRELAKRAISVKYDAEVFGDQRIGKTTEGDYFIVYKKSDIELYKISYICYLSRFIICDYAGTEVFHSTTTSPITETADYIENNLK